MLSSNLLFLFSFFSFLSLKNEKLKNTIKYKKRPLKSFLPLKSYWECSLSGQTHQTPKMALQFYHTLKVSLNHLQEFSTTMASEPPPDRLRPCNRNLRPPNKDLHQIGKQTLSIKSPVRTAHGITSEKRVDAYTLEKRNAYETPKFLKVAPILPAMHLIATQVFLLYYCTYLYLFIIFSPFCTYIFLPSLFTSHFLKIADWQSKACVLKNF